MKMYKGEKAEKKILFLAGILILALTLIVSVAVLAANTATQNASTNKATSIVIKNQAGTTAVATITFPAAEPGTEVEAPYNDVDTSSSPQAWSATASKPVVQLVSATTYNLWWKVTEISGWDTTVNNENCYITDSTTVTKAIFDGAKATLTTWGTETNTTQQVTSAKKYFYLTITPEAVGGKTGSSTLTILGETP